MPRVHRAVLSAAFLTLVPVLARAQPAAALPLSSQQIALACAPPPVIVEPRPHALHVVGAQDAVARSVFDERDLLIVDGGTSKGMQLGQMYFVRRPVAAPNYAGRSGRHAIHTDGWIRIVATNDATAIALVEHVCGAIQAGDYLEPFAAPAAPSEVKPAGNPSDLDFGAMGRVLFGQDERAVVSPGEFLFIDRGANDGVASGARFAIYRDVQTFLPAAGMRGSARLPLAAVGEGVVISSGPSTAVMEVVAVRDAVQAGDYVVPRKR